MGLGGVIGVQNAWYIYWVKCSSRAHPPDMRTCCMAPPGVTAPSGNHSTPWLSEVQSRSRKYIVDQGKSMNYIVGVDKTRAALLASSSVVTGACQNRTTSTVGSGEAGTPTSR